MKILFCLLLAAGLSVSAHARIWTSTDGKEIEADFVSAKDGSVTIKRADGKSFTLPLIRFSKADQDFVAEQKAGPSDAAPKPIEGPYAKLITGDWALSTHDDLPFALYGSKELSAAKKYPLLLAPHGKSDNNENGKQLEDWIKTFASPENYAEGW